MGNNSSPSRRSKFGFPLLTTLLLLGISVPALAEYVPVYHPELEISRLAGTIDIDGVLDDTGWQGAAKADNFAEHNPGDQTQPEVPTEVLITYDDDHLYVAWICYDDPAEVRATFCERDRIFNDDYVILCIDPFGDATMAYEISANPYGIPGDLIYSSAYGEDISYDMIFESAGRINHEGWIVEMEIPFASMRFPQRDEQAWRVDFWRNRPRESRYQYSWAAYDRDENCWPCNWGHVSGITGVKPGKGFE
ncbi:MAG: carbohydrate binding family 9 domain-containing protein, partial [bacterium]